MRKRIVILANSIKHNPSRCIAGREITAENNDLGTGPWVRPVSRVGEGELSPKHFTLEGGGFPQILDIIDIYVDAPDLIDVTQPENWVVTDRHAWKRIQKWDIKMVIDSFVENPPNLWLQHGLKTDRVTKEFLMANPPPQSLYLLKLHNATIIKKTEKKYRLHFSHNDTTYDLAITDPLIISITGAEPVTVIRSGIACVSLAPAFYNQYDGQEYHYKLAAMVISYE